MEKNSPQSCYSKDDWGSIWKTCSDIWTVTSCVLGVTPQHSTLLLTKKSTLLLAWNHRIPIIVRKRWKGLVGKGLVIGWVTGDTAGDIWSHCTCHLWYRTSCRYGFIHRGGTRGCLSKLHPCAGLDTHILLWVYNDFKIYLILYEFTIILKFIPLMFGCERVAVGARGRCPSINFDGDGPGERNGYAAPSRLLSHENEN
jgi:hypothetical protein